MTQRIRTGVGEQVFVDFVVPKAPSDAGYQVALGDQDTPGAWQTPTVIVPGATTVTLRLLVGNTAYNPVDGYYWKWWRKSTSPETFVRTSATDTVEIDTGGGIDIGTGIPWASHDDIAVGDDQTLSAAKAYTDLHSGGGVLTAVATATVSGHRMVRADDLGGVVVASNTVADDALADLFLTTGAAMAGAAVNMLGGGRIDDPSWSWTRGPVWLGANGLLTQTRPTAPAAVFLRQVGSAAGPTSLYVNPRTATVYA